VAASPSHMWYVRAAGGVWGPYPEARVAGFVAEGRVRAETPLSPWAEGPFTPAAVNPEFRPLFASVAAQAPRSEAVAAARPVAAVREPQSRPAEASQDPAPATGPARILVIWAEVAAERLPAFHAVLGGLGAGVTIQPGLWLVQARAAPAAVRNALSRRLAAADQLLVVEATLDQTAWFNLPRDRDIRTLWRATAGLGAARPA
jgi:hypothetical protein